MYDYSFDGILRQIESLTAFSLVYIIGAGFAFGAVAGFYWGIRKTIMVGVLVTVLFFLFLSYRHSGLTPAMLDTFMTYFQAILYMLIGVVGGAVLSQLVFSNRY